MNYGAIAAADAAGLIAVRLTWGRSDSPRFPKVPLTLEAVRDVLIAPVLGMAVEILEAGEFFGRVRFHLLISRLGEFAQLIQQDNYRDPPVSVPMAENLALPGALDDRHGASPAGLLADQWRDDLG